MNTERHLDELGIVIGANVIGWMPTLLQFEEIIRVLGLLVALIYTSLKIVDWFKDRRATKNDR
jgi:hypothetical protein